MNTVTRLVGFLVALVAVFGAALGLGRVVGPLGTVAEPSHPGGAPAGPGDDVDAEVSDVPQGLLVSQDGYSLRLLEPTAPAGADVPVALRILGPGGGAVTEFDVAHEQRLHLIAVRRDLTGFQHVHPELDGTGTWRTALDLTAGHWRVFADFQAAGADALTLGADLSVPGRFVPAALPAPERTVAVGDYSVALTGDLRAGAVTGLRFTVTRDGQPVRDLEPYLGSLGHLVALREGDLAYLHVHPRDGSGAARGPAVEYDAEVPSEAAYRLFLEFQHEGVVRTAAFTAHAASGTLPAGGGTGGAGDQHDGH